jgi:hypothetical protein
MHAGTPLDGRLAIVILIGGIWPVKRREILEGHEKK